jgi:glycogen synthase
MNEQLSITHIAAEDANIPNGKVGGEGFDLCGISQMLAMAHGQLWVVHATGGLRATVKDGETGFVF